MKKIYFLVCLGIVLSSCTPKNYYSFQSNSKPHSRLELTEDQKSESELKTIKSIANEQVPETTVETADVALASKENNSISKVVKSAKVVESYLKIKELAERKAENKESGVKITREEKRELRKAKKEAKKDLRKSLYEVYQESSGKSQVVALILVIVIGGLGIHRFYLGYTTIGIIQLLTLGGCGIWALIDLIRIATGDLQPKNGTYDKTL